MINLRELCLQKAVLELGGIHVIQVLIVRHATTRGLLKPRVSVLHCESSEST